MNTSLTFLPYEKIKTTLTSFNEKVLLSEKAWQAMEQAAQAAMEIFLTTPLLSYKVPRPVSVEDSRTFFLLRNPSSGKILPMVLLTRRLCEDRIIGEGSSCQMKYGIDPTTGKKYAVLVQRFCKQRSGWDLSIRQEKIIEWHIQFKDWETHLFCLQGLAGPFVPTLLGFHYQSFFENPHQDREAKLMTFMEEYPQGDLYNALPKIPVEQIKRLAMRILKIVAFLQNRGVSHLDIKPENFLIRDINEPEGVVLTDFAFAQRSGPFAGRMRGSPQCMAPEIARFHPGNAVDSSKADLWSLGATLFSIFTRKLLLETLFTSFASLLASNDRIERETPDGLRLFTIMRQAPIPFIQGKIDALGLDRNDEIPEEYRPVLQKLLRADPKERELTFPLPHPLMT